MQVGPFPADLAIADKIPAMFSDVLDLLRHPVAALATIDARRKLPDGLLALAVSVTLPAAVSELAGVGPFRPPTNLGALPSLTAQGADIYARWVYQHRFVLPIYGIVVSVLLWLAAAGLIHLIARALGGRGDFAGLVKLLGYAALVGLVALPVTVADALLKVQGNARAELSVGQLAGLLGVALFLWQNVLLVLATREHYAISTERAVASVIGPIGAVLVLILALIILVIILAIVAQQPT